MSNRTPRYWLMVATLLVMSLAITVVFVVIGESDGHCDIERPSS